MTSVQHLSALGADIALRARTVLAMSDQVVVALAVLDADSRAVLHGAAALPSVKLQQPPGGGRRPASLSASTPSLHSALDTLFTGLALGPRPAVLVDVVETPGLPRSCELRFATTIEHREGALCAPSDGLRWLSVDSPTPFFTTDWAVLCAALQDLLAEPDSAVDLFSDTHHQVS